MDESLWPARNIAEYAYCPRLFYYMEVEGIHVPSEDTEQGNRVHRRVDKPSHDKPRRERPDGSESPDLNRTVRSMTLTSPSLQLTATMDLVEIDGTTAVPVEYRKGRPRRIYANSDNSSPLPPGEGSRCEGFLGRGRRYLRALADRSRSGRVTSDSSD